jgi:hypothetical protein
VFPDLAMIGRVETEVERNGKIERETRYSLSLFDRPLPLSLSLASCGRTWGVFRTGQGPENMSIICHAALNLLSRAKPTVSLKNRRKRAGWNVDYLETVIRQKAMILESFLRNDNVVIDPIIASEGSHGEGISCLNKHYESSKHAICRACGRRKNVTRAYARLLPPVGRPPWLRPCDRWT